jgi:uncharacterized membrane protein (UPF0127 family)
MAPVQQILFVDGWASAVRVRRAVGWFARARGVWPDRRWPASQALLLPGCRSIHTCGLARPLDVVFTDEEGRVLVVHRAVPPWRVRSESAACATWEFAAGVSARLGIVRGGRLNVRRMRGATLVEFMLAAMLVVFPMVFVTLELARLIVTSHALQHAVNDTAREAGFGAPSGVGLRQSLAYGLLPLFLPSDPAAALAPRPAGPAELEMEPGVAALAVAYRETFRPDLLDVRRETPEGGIADPGFGAIDWPEGGGAWRLRVRYCRELIFPLARQLISGVARWRNGSPFEQACLARERVPIEAWAMVLRPRWEPRSLPGDLPTPQPPGPLPIPIPLPTPDPPPDPVPPAPINPPITPEITPEVSL